jgi:hypothetical protein
MQGGLEAAGDLITGTIVAHAVEPEGGSAFADGLHKCQNCHTDFSGNHCSNCGQSAHIHNSLVAFGHDLLHGVFHFDSKIWRTLPMLVFKPGELTRRYIDGERVRFVSPLALFLFSVFAMFAVFSSLGGHIEDMADMKPRLVKEARKKLTAEISDVTKQIVALTTKRAAAVSSGVDVGDIDDDLIEQRDSLASAKVALARIAGKADDDPEYGNKTNPAFTISGGSDSDVSWLDKRITPGIEKANKNPGLFLYKLQSTAYKYSWGLIPLSLPFVWLIFAWRREFKLYDHLVFVTYSLCFMSALVITTSLIGQFPAIRGVALVLLLIVPPLHMYKQLRGTYRLRRGAALIRTIYLFNTAMIVLISFIVSLLVLGLVG